MDDSLKCELSKMRRFDDFLAFRSFSEFEIFRDDRPDVRWKFQLEPLRGEDGALKRVVHNQESLPILRVVPPIEDRTPEQNQHYARSPVKEHEYYFCKFENGQWRMSETSDFENSLALEMAPENSTKTGFASNVISANSCVPASVDSREWRLVANVYVDQLGNEANSDPHLTLLIKKAPDGSLYLFHEQSPAKQMWLCKKNDSRILVESLQGYGGGSLEFLQNLSRHLFSVLKGSRVNLPIADEPYICIGDYCFVARFESRLSNELLDRQY